MEIDYDSQVLTILKMERDKEGKYINKGEILVKVHDLVCPRGLIIEGAINPDSRIIGEHKLRKERLYVDTSGTLLENTLGEGAPLGVFKHSSSDSRFDLYRKGFASSYFLKDKKWNRISTKQGYVRITFENAVSELDGYLAKVFMGIKLKKGGSRDFYFLLSPKTCINDIRPEYRAINQNNNT